MCDLSDPPKLELQKKHTIEVVIDRFKVRDDLTQRLAESFETALELSGGTAVVADMDDPKAEELLFSANFACPICGYSMRELEPACSRLTTQRARVQPVTVSACSSISILTG